MAFFVLCESSLIGIPAFVYAGFISVACRCVMGTEQEAEEPAGSMAKVALC